MTKHITVGIDCGTHTTRVVVTEEDPKTGDFSVLGTGTSQTRGMRHGYVTNPDHAIESVRKAIKEAEKQCNVPLKRAIIAIGGITLGSDIGQGTAIISKADNEVTALDVEKAVKASEEGLQLANKRIIYVAPIAFRLDGKEIYGRPDGMHGIKLEVKTLFVTCLSQHIEDLEAVMMEAGIEVLDIIPAPIAASAVTLTDRQRTVGCALVNIGAETVSIAVFENGTLAGLHVFSIGSTDITNDIALGLKISLDEAEHIKLSGGGANIKRKLDDIIEARFSDIFELIGSYLKKIKRSGLLPAGIILTGGGANAPMIEALSKELLMLPARVGAGDGALATKTKLRDSVWFTALGLSVLGIERRIDRHIGGPTDWGKKIKDFLAKLFDQFKP